MLGHFSFCIELILDQAQVDTELISDAAQKVFTELFTFGNFEPE